MKKAARVILTILYVLLIIIAVAFIVCDRYGVLTFIPDPVAEQARFWVCPAMYVVNAVLVISLSLGIHKEVVPQIKHTVKPVKKTTPAPQKPIATENRRSNKNSNSGWLK